MLGSLDSPDNRLTVIALIALKLKSLDNVDSLDSFDCIDCHVKLKGLIYFLALNNIEMCITYFSFNKLFLS